MFSSAERKPELDKYELLEEIGHGGMATVYRARDKRLGRDVAIKIIHRHLRENQEVATRFVSEARAVAKVKHHNIVEVYDVSDAGDPERYLVVELVRGVTLRKTIADNGYLPAEIGAAIGIEVAAGLEHAHAHGIVHRDVKPENVLICTPTPSARESIDDIQVVRVKITDFGIAKLLDAQGVTSTGQVLGSPAHMSPEQIEGGDVSAASDVFGLGVLLYEAMVGKLPFDGKNPAQVLRRVLDGSFTPPDRARPTIGAKLGAIVAKALAHDPKDRYQSTAEVGEALREELKRVGFDDPRRELYDFLREPTAYQKSHESRVVQSLIARAQLAREERDVPLAAACFNRALAFRPDDPELLAQVANLARGERVRRALLRVGGGVIGSVVLLAVVFGVARAVRGTDSPPETPSAKPVFRPPAAIAPPAPLATSTVQPPAPKPPPARKPSPPTTAPRAGRTPVPVAPAEPELTKVRILVDGPKDATVKVDGAETAWFGPPIDIAVGPHTFEFLPKNDECCEGGQVLTVNVLPPAKPGQVQTVRGRIEFKPAVLAFRGEPGSSASCGELGSFPIPSQQTIRMEVAAVRGRCMIFPPPASAEPPKEFDVTLSPGRVFTLPGP